MSHDAKDWQKTSVQRSENCLLRCALRCETPHINVTLKTEVAIGLIAASNSEPLLSHGVIGHHLFGEVEDRLRVQLVQAEQITNVGSVPLEVGEIFRANRWLQLQECELREQQLFAVGIPFEGGKARVLPLLDGHGRSQELAEEGGLVVG